MWGRLAKLLFALLVLSIGLLIFLKSLEYYQPDFSKGYLWDKKEAFKGVFKYGLYAHILASPLVLFIGTFQILFRYEYKWRKLHRYLGMVYAALVLVLAAPGGFIMGLYATGGFATKLGFVVLAVLWWFFTFWAWRKARSRDYPAHKRFMWRSYVLTLSAINLRLLSFVVFSYVDIPVEEAYTYIAWLSWMPAWLLLELYLGYNRRRPLA